jgi:hypothetical protein
VQALSGDGIHLNATGEYVRVPQSHNDGANLDLREGTVDFCFRPDFDHTNGGEHALCSTSDVRQAWMLARISGSNDDSINVILRPDGGGFEEILIDGQDYAMSANQWYRLTISWDFVNVGQNEQNMPVYLDGAELNAATYNSFGPKSVNAPDANADVEIGAHTSPQGWVADGVIDESRVYDAALVPRGEAAPGLKGCQAAECPRRCGEPAARRAGGRDRWTR